MGDLSLFRNFVIFLMNTWRKRIYYFKLGQWNGFSCFSCYYLTLYFFFLLINFCLHIFVICLLRHGPPRLAFASCGHALSVNRCRKIKKCVCVWIERTVSWGGSWDFRFCGSIQVLVRFFGFRTTVFRFWCLARFAGDLQFS